MAFRHPQHRPHTARQLSFPESNPVPVATAQRKRSLEESEEWVLFSPTAAPSAITKTHTASTERTPRTAALSRLSDFGSLDTAARSDDENITEHGSEPDDEAELDSLDDGLHAFHEPSDVSSPRHRLDHSEGVFPTHDGFGAFGDSSAAMHQQLWQFERSHRKKQRRTSSVQRTLDALDALDGSSQESERMRRIEKWRLEQSRALLEEIERETRRMRRMSRANASRPRADSVALQSQTQPETAVSTAGVNTPALGEAPQLIEPIEQHPSEEETKSFWQNFTERVIRDLIGIDENLLSIILGEDLPAECQAPSAFDSSPKPDISHAMSLEDREADIPLEETWQHRLLARIARELGILVHQLSGHPGAFSTYLRAHETPSYAGLPGTSTPTAPMLNSAELGPSSSHAHQSTSSPSGALFQPTVHHPDASLWGIEEEDERESPILHPSPSTAANAAAIQAEREYWEKELDIKMVFTFLKSRFSSRSPSPSPADGPAGLPPGARRLSAFTTASTRAALIRQHHPLTSRTADRRREPRHAHAHYPSAPSAPPFTRRLGHTHHARTRSSSCASQSTRKSKRSAGGSSRNFWDIGGSGSLVGSASGAVGVWGEA